MASEIHENLRHIEVLLVWPVKLDNIWSDLQKFLLPWRFDFVSPVITYQWRLVHIWKVSVGTWNLKKIKLLWTAEEFFDEQYQFHVRV